MNNGLFKFKERRPTLTYPYEYTTIGPAGLNFRIRNGNGCFPRGKSTPNFYSFIILSTITYNFSEKLHFKSRKKRFSIASNAFAWLEALDTYPLLASGIYKGQANRLISTH